MLVILITEVIFLVLSAEFTEYTEIMNCLPSVSSESSGLYYFSLSAEFTEYAEIMNTFLPWVPRVPDSIIYSSLSSTLFSLRSISTPYGHPKFTNNPNLKLVAFK